jgi:pSer/pThr/pTyr-binding forkhead associated (FHA) protein
MDFAAGLSRGEQRRSLKTEEEMAQHAGAAKDALQETALENPIQKTLKQPAPFGSKVIHLSVIEGDTKGVSYNITAIGTYTIGRYDCDIVLNDDKVSRKHTSISVVRPDKFLVTDLASRNGTFVNGARAGSQDLKHNDLIRIGDTTFRFTVFDGPIPVTQ